MFQNSRSSMLLIFGVMLFTTVSHCRADITVVSDSQRYRIVLRQVPQALLPVRESVFYADLNQVSDSAPVNEYTPVTQRRNATGQIEYIDSDGVIVTTGKTVTTHIWMQMGDHGHGGSATANSAEPRGSNHLVVRRVFFTMSGPWQLIFTFRDGAHVVDRAVANVVVERPVLP